MSVSASPANIVHRLLKGHKVSSGPMEDRLPVFSLIYMSVEFIALIFSGFISSWLYHWIAYSEAPSQLWMLSGVSAATIFVLLQTISGKYSSSIMLGSTLGKSNLLRDWLITFATVLAFSFLIKQTSEQSRGAYLVFSVFGFLVLLILRSCASLLLAQAVKTSHFVARRIVLIGPRADVERYFTNEKLWRKGIQVAATIGTDQNPTHNTFDVWINESQLFYSKNSIEEVAEQLRGVEADDIVLLLPWSATKIIENILEKITTLPAAIYLAPDPALELLNSNLGGLSNLSEALTDPQSGLSGIRIIRRPLNPISRLGKRLFDIFFSGVGLIFLLPLFIILATLIRLESAGSPLYRQQRHGFNERPFFIYKFRSMIKKQENVFSQTKKNDPRITRIGAFIRRTNLDELPQLLNVFLGSMSLVGPRPHALEHNNEFMTEIANYANRHHVKPGITGWAQVNGWRGATQEKTQMDKRIDHDLEYIQNWSFGLDLKILFFTFFSRKAFNNAF
ncbi:MAG: exopolysaccharide biosynthesis polyprenyl glycosylphosphotransferase [Devosiaceae bacterium]|nr:exopolysaccharide biosynthesis polyprenyl glycosylphosphotransferase [Devosiaceae bacterium]